MGDNRRADWKDIPGQFRLHRVIDENSGKVIGTAAVTHWAGAAIIWNIFVVAEHRRQYWGRCLVEAMKHAYRRITTSWYSDEGKALMLACGFTLEVSPSNVPQLVWVKGVNGEPKSKEEA